MHAGFVYGVFSANISRGHSVRRIRTIYIRFGHNANACRVQDALRLFKTTPVFIKLVKTSIILSSPLSPSSSLSPVVCAIKSSNERYSLAAPFAYATTHSHERWKMYALPGVMPMAAFAVIIVYSSVVLKYTICRITSYSHPYLHPASPEPTQKCMSCWLFLSFYNFPWRWLCGLLAIVGRRVNLTCVKKTPQS